MTSKRIITGILAAMLVLSTFAGCSNNSATVDKDESENTDNNDNKNSEPTGADGNNEAAENDSGEQNRDAASVNTEAGAAAGQIPKIEYDSISPEGYEIPEYTVNNDAVENASENLKNGFDNFEFSEFPEYKAPTVPKTDIDLSVDFELEIPTFNSSDLKVPEFNAEFSAEYPELDFSGITVYDPNDHPALQEFKAYFADNVYADDFEKIDSLTEEELTALVEKKNELLESLERAVREGGINININRFTGEIVLDSAFLFGFDESEVSEEGKSILKRFAEIYSSVVVNEEYLGFIEAVLVEGHTDTNGDYDYNLELSQKRADNVMAYCLSPELGLNPIKTNVLRNYLRAVGYSYNDPVYAVDGTVDAAASRRVSFRLIINIG